MENPSTRHWHAAASANGCQRPSANGRRLRPDDAPTLPVVSDDRELVGACLDPFHQSSDSGRQELVENTPTATVQLERPGDSMGRNLRIEEPCDHLVALVLLLRPPWRFIVGVHGTRSAGGAVATWAARRPCGSRQWPVSPTSGRTCTSKARQR